MKKHLGKLLMLLIAFNLCSGYSIELEKDSGWLGDARKAGLFDSYKSDLRTLQLLPLEEEFRVIAQEIVRGENTPRFSELPVVGYRFCMHNAFGEPIVVDIKAYPSKDHPKEIDQDRIEIRFRGLRLGELMENSRILAESEFQLLLKGISDFEIFDLPFLKSANPIVAMPILGSRTVYFEECINGVSRLIVRDLEDSPGAKAVSHIVMVLARVGLEYDPFEWSPEKKESAHE